MGEVPLYGDASLMGNSPPPRALLGSWEGGGFLWARYPCTGMPRSWETTPPPLGSYLGPGRGGVSYG